MKIRVSQDSLASTVVLSGDVDEKVTEGLREVSSQVKAPDVTFDCDAVQNINSIGIRQWMLFMATFGAQRKLHFRRCPPALVDYAVMIPKVFGAGRVSTIYLSYYCEACNLSSKVLLELQHLKDDRSVALSKCSRCAAELQTDMDLDLICQQLMS